jgi:hypothetical protein
MAADNDWSKPKAVAIPKEGYFTLQQGRYGPTYPRTPTIIAKIKPGTEAREASRSARQRFSPGLIFVAAPFHARHTAA